MRSSLFMSAALASLVLLPATGAIGAGKTPASCPIDEVEFSGVLKSVVKPSGGPSNGGLDNNMWGAVVDRGGKVCAIAFTGKSLGDQWPGSRTIAIEKANTANALSLPHFALSTANLYAGSQPGGFLFGLAATNPPDTQSLYAGNPSQYGTSDDPMLNKPASGVVVFGGGLPLYDGKTIVGAIGVSGDTSCADHNVAWRLRHAMKLDHVPGGVSANKNDAIIYDFGMLGKSSSGYGHPTCGHKEEDVAKQIGSTASAK
jgi:uncharacterized protein GlcG (DUF336 family)